MLNNNDIGVLVKVRELLKENYKNSNEYIEYTELVEKCIKKKNWHDNYNNNYMKERRKIDKYYGNNDRRNKNEK